jgi:hypothetical protein
MTTDNSTLEHELQEAHLLCVRHEYDEAEKLLNHMSRRYPGNAEIQYMLGRIKSTHQVENEVVERSRSIRYTFGLITMWRRLGWGLAALAATGYGGWGEFDSLQRGFTSGFANVITTMISDKRGTHPYTRPIYWDVAMYGVILVIGLVMLVLLVMASKGVAQWEELDVPVSSSRYGGW